MVEQGIIWLGVACGMISYIISDATIFLPFREWICKKNIFLGKLFSCGMCVTVWIGFGITLIYLPNLFNIIPFIDELLTSFIISCIGSFIWIIMSIFIKIADK